MQLAFMSLILCLLHYASYIMHLTLCLQHYASCILPLALCLLHYASCNKELIGSKEYSSTLKSLDPQYPRKKTIISRNLRRTRKRKFPETLKNVKCFIFESGNTKSPCQTKQDIFVSTIISYCLTNKFFKMLTNFQITFTKVNYSKMELSLNLATMNTTSVWIPLCKQKISCHQQKQQQRKYISQNMNLCRLEKLLNLASYQATT